MIYITKQKGLNQNKGCLPFGQSSRFTVWVNGKQNSRLVNFVPEWSLPFVQISSIFRKTAAKAWNRYQRWLWRNGIRISLSSIPTGQTRLPSQMFRCCSWKFSVGTTHGIVIHLLSNQWLVLKLKTAGTKYMLSSEDSFEIKSLSTAEHYFFRIGWSLIQSTGPFLPRANKCIFQTTTLFLRTPMVHFVR